ncbi:MAG TPA: phospholipid carrier-dependent glycosyltransferase [Motilibacteraceae bacterium]|nr:phospholipid carrier-dependent glycosyltransferase [Motilibacteraceae bacterium]
MAATSPAAGPLARTASAPALARRATRAAAGARARLLTPMPADGVWGWLGPLLVAVLAGVLRFWRLGVPANKIFDEIYYATEGNSMLHYGVEYKIAEHVPEFVVHPPVGKWVIAAGIWLFGDNSFGWRAPIALLGTLSVLVLARVARRMFRSTALGCAAGLLLAVDGQHYVESRTALLDLTLSAFALFAFAALVVDRDRSRARLAGVVERSAEGGPDRLGRFGPGLGLRPWRLVAGLMLGLACATKWNGVFFLAVFGLMTVLWDLGARRAAGVRRPWLGTLLRDALPAFVSLVVVSLAVYLVSWTGWFRSDPAHAYDRGWAATRPASGLGSLVPDALRSLWHYHAEMLHFNTTLHAFHPYKSNPWGWPVLARPVSFFYEQPVQGDRGCQVDKCSQAITAIGNPVVWWGGTLALLLLLLLWAGTRDWRAGAVLAGVVAGWVPWFDFQSRTIFSFYAVAFVPYLVLALVLALSLVAGPPGASLTRRRWGGAAAGAVVALAAVNFAWMYPVLSAVVIPYSDWAARMLLPSWI